MSSLSSSPVMMMILMPRGIRRKNAPARARARRRNRLSTSTTAAKLLNERTRQRRHLERAEPPAQFSAEREALFFY